MAGFKIFDFSYATFLAPLPLKNMPLLQFSVVHICVNYSLKKVSWFHTDF